MQRKKLSFNLLDVIIVLALALLACGIIWRQELTKQIALRDTQNTVPVLCTVSVLNSTELEAGEKEATLVAGNKATLVKDEDSAGTAGEVRLKLTAVELESGYYLADGSKLLVEESYVLHSGNKEYSIRILSLSELDEAE